VLGFEIVKAQESQKIFKINHKVTKVGVTVVGYVKTYYRKPF
jgi:hypothetical protein